MGSGAVSRVALACLCGVRGPSARVGGGRAWARTGKEGLAGFVLGSERMGEFRVS